MWHLPDWAPGRDPVEIAPDLAQADAIGAARIVCVCGFVFWAIPDRLGRLPKRCLYCYAAKRAA